MKLVVIPKVALTLFSVLSCWASATSLRSDERSLSLDLRKLRNEIAEDLRIQLEAKQAERELVLLQEVERLRNQQVALHQEVGDLQNQLEERQLIFGAYNELRALVDTILQCVGYDAGTDTCNIGYRTSLNLVAVGGSVFVAGSTGISATTTTGDIAIDATAGSIDVMGLNGFSLTASGLPGPPSISTTASGDVNVNSGNNVNITPQQRLNALTQTGFNFNVAGGAPSISTTGGGDLNLSSMNNMNLNAGQNFNPTAANSWNAMAGNIMNLIATNAAVLRSTTSVVAIDGDSVTIDSTGNDIFITSIDDIQIEAQNTNIGDAVTSPDGIRVDVNNANFRVGTGAGDIVLRGEDLDVQVTDDINIVAADDIVVDAADNDNADGTTGFVITKSTSGSTVTISTSAAGDLNINAAMDLIFDGVDGFALTASGLPTGSFGGPRIQTTGGGDINVVASNNMNLRASNNYNPRSGNSWNAEAGNLINIFSKGNTRVGEFCTTIGFPILAGDCTIPADLM